MVKILTYNVNGIRAAMKKGLTNYLAEEQADVVCFQELKASEDQIESKELSILGYNAYYFSAEKKGYSGVGILSKEEPLHVEYGCGHPVFDEEGRVIRADFSNYSVLSIYFPSGSSGDHRQEIKYQFLDFIYDYLELLRKEIPNLVICGDYNICHRAIDIHAPKRNEGTSGFLPEERAWMDKWFGNGWVDSFRAINGDEKDKYTWWSYRANARANNKGWRIDYISVSESLTNKLIGAEIRANAMHSDHCPSYALLEL